VVSTSSFRTKGGGGKSLNSARASGAGAGGEGKELGFFGGGGKGSPPHPSRLVLVFRGEKRRKKGTNQVRQDFRWLRVW